jgi:hypothetical protein
MNNSTKVPGWMWAGAVLVIILGAWLGIWSSQQAPPTPVDTTQTTDTSNTYTSPTPSPEPVATSTSATTTP